MNLTKHLCEEIGRILGKDRENKINKRLPSLFGFNENYFLESGVVSLGDKTYWLPEDSDDLNEVYVFSSFDLYDFDGKKDEIFYVGGYIFFTDVENIKENKSKMTLDELILESIADDSGPYEIIVDGAKYENPGWIIRQLTDIDLIRKIIDCELYDDINSSYLENIDE